MRALRRARGVPQPGGPFLPGPRGVIDAPADGSDVPERYGYVQIRGWCLFPESSVVRLEVRVGAADPQPARLGMPRPDIPLFTDHPSGPICGFEYMADVRDQAPGREVTIGATAYSSDGRRLELPAASFRVLPAQPLEDDRTAAELRDRAVGFVRHRPSEDGVRMLAFAHQLPYGGASLYLLEVLRRFAERPEFECVVVSLQDGPLRGELERIGIRVHLTNSFPVTSPAQYEGNQAELLAWAAQERFNVAFINTLACFSGADVASRLGIPSVWAIHESFDLPLFWTTAYLPDTLHPYVAWRAEHLLREATAGIFEAEATRRLFLPYADDDRLHTVPYGIELEPLYAARQSYDRTALRRSLGIPEDARVVLCLGTIEARKSQAMLAEAFAGIAERHPDAVLVLVGASDAAWGAQYNEGVREFVDRNGLEDRIRIEPIASDPLRWHAVADFHVCASDLESLPRSILEAMAFGTPVISTRVFGVPEVIRDGETGYLCEARDADDLAAALDRALSADAGALEAITRAAAKLVLARHEPAQYADRVWNLLRVLAEGSPARPGDVLAAPAG